MKTLSIKSRQTVRKLEAMLENEHICGCDSRTCDIFVSHNNGFSLWALYLFDSCGAASDEFSKLYATLPRDFYAHARKEADKMCDTVEHESCPHCNAVVWETENEKEVACDSCGKTFSKVTLDVVVFRKFRKGGDVIALFPKMIIAEDGTCESYQHIGQHGGATYSHCMKITVPASASEYASLKTELENIGYKLIVKEKK